MVDRATASRMTAGLGAIRDAAGAREEQLVDEFVARVREDPNTLSREEVDEVVAEGAPGADAAVKFPAIAEMRTIRAPPEHGSSCGFGLEHGLLMKDNHVAQAAKETIGPR